VAIEPKIDRWRRGCKAWTNFSRAGTSEREVIVLCVRWYLRFKLSLRDLVEMMAERGLVLAHTTIMRWVQRFVPELTRSSNAIEYGNLPTCGKSVNRDSHPQLGGGACDSMIATSSH
jgi:hypothetical protein